MKCCGVENFRDWANTNFGKTGNVPDSCCKVFTDKCGEGKLNVSNETAATRAHCHEYLTVNPANKGFMRASTSSTATYAITESTATKNIIGNWF